MTILSKNFLEARDGGGVLCATGELTLVAGAASEAVPGFTVGACVQVTRKTAGGAVGHLNGSYNGTNVVLGSSSGTDTSVCTYCITES